MNIGMYSKADTVIPVDGTIINIYTPFHLQQCIRLQDDLCLNKASTTVLYVGSYLNIETLKAVLPAARFMEIPDAKFSIRKLRRSPLSYIKECRQKIKGLKDCINRAIAPFPPQSHVRTIVYNDKDAASQLLMSACAKKFRQTECVAVDEGTAFYVNKNGAAWARRIVYSMFTKIVLGEQLHYVDRFGTHPDISVVYLRNLALLPDRKKGIIYREVPKTSLRQPGVSIRVPAGGKTALLLTSCIIESHMMSADKYHAYLEMIVRELLAQHYQVYVKQHPREETEFLQQSQYGRHLHFLDRKSTAEDLHLEDFDRILNFGSSVILDAIDRNYAPSRIITLDILNFKRIKYIIDQTFAIRENDFQEKLKRALTEP